ncbi:hypothetical protein NPIL_462161 [Nephila pilipes]|uniref:Uncharacterized protein n=1 Tax=Nephila pilipes TaxID=299642 RepID=A0A8X6IQZ4_NEPPI|nr:hypothetical protein NPIL_462161 [Nephila pilipes]
MQKELKPAAELSVNYVASHLFIHNIISRRGNSRTFRSTSTKDHLIPYVSKLFVTLRFTFKRIATSACLRPAYVYPVGIVLTTHCLQYGYLTFQLRLTSRLKAQNKIATF